MNIGRNAPCHCGSGRKYKSCHLDIDSKKGLPRLKAFQAKYVGDWSMTSSDFESQGAYTWMAEQLAAHCIPERVLDIGCGSGRGIDALIRRFGKELVVVGLEQNEQCIKNAVSLEDREWSFLLRADPCIVSGNVYEMKFKAGELPKSANGVTIIESDILCDPEIDTYLEELPKFDAVTIWLIGAQQGMQECINLVPLKIKTSGDLRLRIQNKVYELADKILRPGGVLQVVDRVEYPNTPELIADGLRAHREQASVTSLVVSGSTYYEYKAPSSGVGMMVTPGTSGRVADTNRLALRSTISLKPILTPVVTE